MFISSLVQAELLRVVKKYLNTRLEGTSYRDVISLSSDGDFERMIKSLWVYRAKIISEVKHKSEAVDFVHVLTNISPRARSFIRNPPDELFIHLGKSFESLINTGSLPPLRGRLLDDVLTYIGVYSKRGMMFGIYVNPSRSEVRLIESVKRKNIEIVASHELFHFYITEFEVDWRNRLVTLMGRPVYRIDSVKQFYKVIRGLRGSHKIVSQIHRGVEDDVEKVLPLIFKGIQVKDRQISSTAGKIGGDLSVNIPREVSSILVNISFSGGNESGNLVVKTRVWSSVTGGEVSVKNNIYYSGDLDKSILVSLRDSFREFVDKLLVFKRVENVFSRLEDEQGFRRQTQIQEDTYVLLGRIDEKNIVVNVSLRADDTLVGNNPFVELFVSTTLKLEESSLEEEIRRRGLSNFNINNDKSITSITVTYTGNDILRSDLYTTILRDIHIIKQSILSLEASKRRLHPILHHPHKPDEYVVAYLLSVTTPELVKVNKKHLIRGMLRVISKNGSPWIREYVESRKDEFPIILYPDVVVAGLIHSHIVDVSNNNVTINGKPLSKILLENKVEYDPYELEEEVRRGIFKLLSYVKPSIIGLLEREGSVDRSILEEVKKRYVAEAPVENLVEIIENENLQGVFMEVLDTVFNRIIEDGSPSQKTVAIMKYKPEILRGKNLKINLVENDGNYFIKMGSYTLQINKIYDDDVEYIVYKDNKRLGIGRGRTILEAVMWLTK